jgi:hypothetical protein
MSDYKPPRRLPSNLDPGSESGAQIMLDGAFDLRRYWALEVFHANIASVKG